MAHPLRIQRLRKRGWRKPPGAVYVGRPTAWGNPFESAEAFRAWLLRGEIYLSDLRDQSLFPWTPESKTKLQAMREAILGNVRTLRGKQLLCWCGLGQDCHGDVLAELANEKGGGDGE